MLLGNMISISVSALPSASAAYAAYSQQPVNVIQMRLGIQGVLSFLNMVSSAVNLYFTMQYLKGIDLSEYRKEQGEFTTRLMSIVEKITHSHMQFSRVSGQSLYIICT